MFEIEFESKVGTVCPYLWPNSLWACNIAIQCHTILLHFSCILLEQHSICVAESVFQTISGRCDFPHHYTVYNAYILAPSNCHIPWSYYYYATLYARTQMEIGEVLEMKLSPYLVQIIRRRWIAYSRFNIWYADVVLLHCHTLWTLCTCTRPAIQSIENICARTPG